jgi:hypothetical protein
VAMDNRLAHQVALDGLTIVEGLRLPEQGRFGAMCGRENGATFGAVGNSWERRNGFQVLPGDTELSAMARNGRSRAPAL